MRRTRLAPIIISLTAYWVLTNPISYAAERSFLMGTSIFHDFFQLDPENISDKDLLSVHIDNYLGIPWAAFQNGTPPPASWVSRWNTVKNEVAASGKVRYLAIGFFSGDRKTLSDSVDASGAVTSGWAPKDASGCYPFATDANAAANKQAYINYAKWAVNEIQPTYLSPSIELSAALEECPAQTAALIQWYSDVHQALKQAYPNLIIFPTFQAEAMYGVSDSAAWCGGVRTDDSLAACFQQRLNQALSIPADRIAFSFYPASWLLPQQAGDHFTAAVPYEDLFTRVKQSTQRKIWISETGWGAVQILASYQHTSPASACGAPVVPAPSINGESNMAAHLTQLLAQAKDKSFEAVVWWENRDYLDATTAAVCPCAASNSTCTEAEQLYTLAGTGGEFALRSFGNMGLRNYDGTPRSAVYTIWATNLGEPFSSVPGGGNSLDSMQIYPNPMRPALGHTGINFLQLPAGARIRIYTLAGEKVNDLTADVIGHAVWDGTNQAGQKAASGVYLVYVQGSGQTKTLKVAIQR